MVRDESFWKDAIDLNDDYEPIYDDEYIDDVGQVATVDFDLAITDNLIKLADEIRVAKGYEPLWDNRDSDGWYNFHICIEDVNGGRVQGGIYFSANETYEDDYKEYYIELTKEEMEWVYDALANAIEYWGGTVETIRTHLDFARDLLKGDSMK